MRFRVSAVLPIPAETFFVERDSAAFRSLVAKSMKLGALEIVDGWTEGEVEIYKFVTKPDLDKFVPKRLQKYLAKNGLQYTDIITYNPELIAEPPFRLPVRSIPPILPEKSRIECTLTIEHEEPGVTCRQTLEGLVEFSLPGLGRLAERIVVDSLHKVYSGIPAIVERWVVIRDEVLKQDGGREILFSGRPDNHGVDWITDSIQAVVQAPYREDSEGSRGTKVECTSPEEAALVGRDVRKMLSPSCAAADVEGAEEGKLCPEVRPVESAQEVQRAPVEVEGETFYDASGDWLEPEWEGDAATTAAVREDEEAAAQWFETARKAGQQPPCIDLTAGVDMSKPAVPGTDQSSGGESQRRRRVAARRFSTGFSNNEAAWQKFWEHHRVPDLPGIPNLAARLSHLLRLAAAWGSSKKVLTVQLLRKPFQHGYRAFRPRKRQRISSQQRVRGMIRISMISDSKPRHTLDEAVQDSAGSDETAAVLKGERRRRKAVKWVGSLGQFIHPRLH